MTPQKRFPGGVPPTGSLPYQGGGTGPGETRQSDELRRNRDAKVNRSTTRYGTDRFPDIHSPFWLVTIDWDNERCPTCTRPLEPDTDAAYDEDEEACFCLGCASKWLDHLDELRRKPPPKQPRPAKPKHPQPTPDDEEIPW